MKVDFLKFLKMKNIKAKFIKSQSCIIRYYFGFVIFNFNNKIDCKTKE